MRKRIGSPSRRYFCFLRFGTAAGVTASRLARQALGFPPWPSSSHARRPSTALPQAALSAASSFNSSAHQATNPSEWPVLQTRSESSSSSSNGTPAGPAASNLMRIALLILSLLFEAFFILHDPLPLTCLHHIHSSSISLLRRRSFSPPPILACSPRLQSITRAIGASPVFPSMTRPPIVRSRIL